MKSKLHEELQSDAIYWLYRNGCWVFGKEIEWGGRIYDAVGIKKNGTTFCVEVKATQADLEKARQESLPQENEFNFYYLSVAPDLELKNNFSDWGIIRKGSVEKKSKRHESNKSYQYHVDLVFDIANRMCREIYFNNFRGQP